VLCVPALGGSLVVWARSLHYSLHLEGDPFIPWVALLFVSHVALVAGVVPSHRGRRELIPCGAGIFLSLVALSSSALYVAVICSAGQVAALALARPSPQSRSKAE
jgi:hypothetical protein